VTAPARPRRPTREQLLNLADRAERGPLTAAEAARLREGINAAQFGRRAAQPQPVKATRRERDLGRRLIAVQGLVQAARQRGGRAVPVQILDIALRGEFDVRFKAQKLPSS
jgi:hypothetical protein